MPPPPPPDEPPTGIHKAIGIVYEDVDGDGVRNSFAGEMGMAGWTLQLVWNGRVIAETQSDADGNFSFSNLGNSTWSVCVVAQSGYTQTQPAGGSACYEFVLSRPFETWAQNDFGMVLQ